MDDPMQDRNNWGWQATAMSVKERTIYLWKNNPIPFNVTFEVGPEGQQERIGAHRDILAMSSGVFYAMFYGPLAKPRDLNEPIVDDDLDPKAFRLMLKFIYTESIADCDEFDSTDRQSDPFPTGVELAFKSMQAAGKYDIPALHLVCRNYILDDLQKTFKTSEGIAEYGLLYALYARNPEWSNKPIVEAVWREVDAFTEAVLNVSDEVLRVVDEALMVEFLSRTSLNVSKEITLYNFAVRWARLQQEGPRKDETLRGVMRKLVSLLRLSSISQQEWLDGPVKAGIYTLDDLTYKATLAGGIISRCAHDPPVFITFDIFQANAINHSEYIRESNLGQIKIQTQTEGNLALTQLVEKCVRKQMKWNNTESPQNTDLLINFMYMGHENVNGGLLNDDDLIDLSEQELRLLDGGGHSAAEMRLSSGDVAVGFNQSSIDGDDKLMLCSSYLVFGDDTGEQYLDYWLNANSARIFYLGRLTTGQNYLDRWVHYLAENIVYDVTYEKKTLDAAARKKRKIS